MGPLAKAEPQIKRETSPQATKKIVKNQRKVYIDIARGPLSDALILFSLKFNRIIAAESKMIEPYQSYPTQGHLTADQALTLLLKDTPLQVENTANNSFIIKLPDAPKKTTEVAKKNDTKIFIEETLTLGKEISTRPFDTTVSHLYLPQELLNKHNVDSITALSNYASGVKAASKDEGTVQFNIRGIENYGISYQTTSIAPMYIDNRYISEIESSTAILFDIDRVDLLYGPQVTAPGRGAIGGGIYVSSVKPQLNSQGDSSVSVTVGDYDLRRVEGAINASINEKLALRIASVSETRSGFTEQWESYRDFDQETFIPSVTLYGLIDDADFATGNTFSKQPDDSDKFAVRLSLLAKPSPKANIFYSWEKNLNRSNPKGYIDPYIVNRGERAIVVDSDVDREGESETSNIEFTYQHKNLNASYRYTHVKYNYFENQDLDLSRFPGKEEFNIDQHEELAQTHLIEIASAPEKSPLEWLLGFHYATDDLKRKAQFSTLIGSESNLDFERSVIYFDPQIKNHYHDIYTRLQYKAGKDWLFSLGARYNHNRRDMKNSALIDCSEAFIGTDDPSLFSLNTNLNQLRERFQQENIPCDFTSINKEKSTWEGLTYSIGSSYRINEQTKVTLNHSTGFRPGMVGPGFRPEFVRTDYASDSHTSKNYEFGISYQSTDKKLYSTLTLFFNEHNDIAINNPYSPLNAEASGLDLSIHLNNEKLGELAFSASYLNTKVTSYNTIDFVFSEDQPWNPLSQDPPLPEEGFLDLSGNQLTRSPEYTASLNYSYPFNSSIGYWKPAIQMHYSDKYYLDIYNRTDTILSDPEATEKILHRDISTQDAFITFDVSAYWTSYQERYYALLGIYNVSDEQIRTGFRQSFISLDGFVSTYSDPRTIRFTFGINI